MPGVNYHWSQSFELQWAKNWANDNPLDPANTRVERYTHYKATTAM